MPPLSSTRPLLVQGPTYVNPFVTRWLLPAQPHPSYKLFPCEPFMLVPVNSASLQSGNPPTPPAPPVRACRSPALPLICQQCVCLSPISSPGPPRIKISSDGDGGLLKEVLEEGAGDLPNAGDEIRAHYTGKLLDGTTFDSSRTRNKEFKFILGERRVIKGWDEGFATMRKGEKAVLTCREDYAYGERGHPPTIPGGATLKFDVVRLCARDLGCREGGVRVFVASAW